MLITTLKIAQRMLEIGESEEEVASALASFLSTRYPATMGETIHNPNEPAGVVGGIRMVCQNTFQTDPVISMTGEPWHSIK